MGEGKKYYRYWGKADEEGNYHLLVYHCLDVAAVAAYWFDNSRVIQRSFQLNNPEYKLNGIRAWILFFIALHDIGKIDIRFQMKAPKVFRILNPNFKAIGITQESINKYYHGPAGLYWFYGEREFERISGNKEAEKKESSNCCIDFFDDEDDNNDDPYREWFESVCGHHGHLYKSNNSGDYSLSLAVPGKLKESFKAARKEFVLVFEEMFLKPQGLSLKEKPPVHSISLAGFCSINDWLGSNRAVNHFEFVKQETDLVKYFETKYTHDAPFLINAIGLLTKPKDYKGIIAILKKEYSPRQLQTKIDLLPIKQGLTIVEGSTGSGKTELALAYAWKLIEAKLADSIIFALPSQATANGMLPRLDKLAGVLFQDHPNLLLAHGNAKFSDVFLEIQKRGNTLQGNNEAIVQCNEWLAQSRKRALLGQIGVCTVDQVLLSVLPVRHRFIRQFCAGRSVLIVDEVHAYDQYMYGLLIEVIHNQLQAGGSVILLSATLPGYQKQQLLKAWDYESDDLSNKKYPLISNISTDGYVELGLQNKEFPQPENLKRVKKDLYVCNQMIPGPGLTGQITKEVQNGVTIAIICNLVDDAQNIYQCLLNNGLEVEQVMLFHSRYTLNDRQTIEKKVLRYFGEENRVKGKVLVATQVIEQSLNVDFDWMISQLCPIDLLFQRAGRLHRFNLKNRPEGFEEPLLTILLPDEDFNYGTHELIYNNKRVMWRTEKLLKQNPAYIIFPDVYRPWIERVYQMEKWNNEPEKVTEAYIKYEGEIAFIQQLKAKMILKSAMNPLPDTYIHAQTMTRDGEMSLSIIPFIRVNGGKELISGKLIKKIDKIRDSEDIYMNTVNVPGNWYHWIKEYLEEGDEGILWFEMHKENSSFIKQVNKRQLFYSSTLGFKKEEKEGK